MRDWVTLVRRAREIRSWTQGQLAEHLDVDQGTVSRWERGKAIPDHAIQGSIVDLLHAQSLPYLRHYIRNTPGVCGLLRASDIGFCECISIVAARAYGKTPEEMEGCCIRHIVHPTTVKTWDRIESHPGWVEGEIATIGATYQHPQGWYYALMGQHPVHTNLLRYQSGPCSRREDMFDVTYFRDLK